MHVDPEQLELCFDRKAEDEDMFASLPRWLRADQVRKLLGECSEEFLRSLRHAGLIECRDFRGPGSNRPTFKYYRESVRAYLASRPGGKTDY